MSGVVDEALTLSVDDFWAQLSDRRFSTTLILSAVVGAGMLLLVLAHIGVQNFDFVPAQAPYVASGTLMGLALVGTGLRLLSVHLERVEAADERRHLNDVQRAALQALTVLLERSASPAPSPGRESAAGR